VISSESTIRQSHPSIKCGQFVLCPTREPTSRYVNDAIFESNIAYQNCQYALL